MKLKRFFIIAFFVVVALAPTIGLSYITITTLSDIDAVKNQLAIAIESEFRTQPDVIINHNQPIVMGSSSPINIKVIVPVKKEGEKFFLPNHCVTLSVPDGIIDHVSGLTITEQQQCIDERKDLNGPSSFAAVKEFYIRSNDPIFPSMVITVTTPDGTVIFKPILTYIATPFDYPELPE